MSEHMPTVQPRPPDVDANPAACHCHEDAPGGAVQESDACRCHLLDAVEPAREVVERDFETRQDQRIAESAWQPGRVPVPSERANLEPPARASRFRMVLGAIILLPLLAGAVVLVVSGFVPVLVATIALFLPVLVPLALVGLGILFTGEIQAIQQQREWDRRSQEPAANRELASVIR